MYKSGALLLHKEIVFSDSPCIDEVFRQLKKLFSTRYSVQFNQSKLHFWMTRISMYFPLLFSKHLCQKLRQLCYNMKKVFFSGSLIISYCRLNHMTGRI